MHAGLKDAPKSICKDRDIRGFRLGARMILDVVGEYDSPMVQVNELEMAE